MLSIFLVSLWSLSYYVGLVLRHDMERTLGDQQFATVSVVAAQINGAVRSRLSGLEAVATTLAPAMAEGPAAVQTALERHATLQTMFNAGVSVIRHDGTAIADAPMSVGRIGVNYRDAAFIATALDQGVPVVGKPVMGRRLKAPSVGMAVPIRDARGVVVGALTGSTHLGKPNFLEQVTTGVYGKTGGYMLVDRDSRLVVSATDKGRIMETLPSSGTSSLVGRFLDGYEGFGVGWNPQGREVLASAKGIPLAGWYIAAALPVEEAFAPVHGILRQMQLATVALSVLAGGLTWWMVRRHLAPVLDAAIALTGMGQFVQQAQPLRIVRPDEIGLLMGRFNQLLETVKLRDRALTASEAFKNVVLNSVAANIVVLDRQGLIVAVNEPWRRFALENGGKESRTGVGQNYLSACQAGPLDPGGGTSDVAQGIRAVLDGSLPSYSMEYPCHSDAVQRWFSLTATPLRGGSEGAVVAHTDITEAKQAEQKLRIAATAFESQQAMLVIGADRRVLRVNRAFTLATGYSASEVEGNRSGVLRSTRHPEGFYEASWKDAMESGAWTGELWYQRRDGTEFLARTSITAVLDAQGTTTHYVGNFVDVTGIKQQEEQRLRNEAAHREVLVREVHHRIKNNLQGIVGMLGQFARQHPLTANLINDAISQVQSISVIHGLQGRIGNSKVRLCELTVAIAERVEALWHTTVEVRSSAQFAPRVIAENEAVPIALVLNELITNAVKHRRGSSGSVHIVLDVGARQASVCIRISNPGELAPPHPPVPSGHAGLALVEALLPRSGAHLVMEQHAENVVTQLELEPPVISMEYSEELKEAA